MTQRYQTADGVRWRVRWREDGGRMRSPTLATKREAQVRCGHQDAPDPGEALPRPGRETLAQAFDELWRLRGCQLATSTQRSHLAVWNAHVRGRFDHHRLATLVADPRCSRS